MTMSPALCTKFPIKTPPLSNFFLKRWGTGAGSSQPQIRYALINGTVQRHRRQKAKHHMQTLFVLNRCLQLAIKTHSMFFCFCFRLLESIQVSKVFRWCCRQKRLTFHRCKWHDEQRTEPYKKREQKLSPAMSMTNDVQRHRLAFFCFSITPRGDLRWNPWTLTKMWQKTHLSEWKADFSQMFWNNSRKGTFFTPSENNCSYAVEKEKVWAPWKVFFQLKGRLFGLRSHFLARKADFSAGKVPFQCPYYL